MLTPLVAPDSRRYRWARIRRSNGYWLRPGQHGRCCRNWVYPHIDGIIRLRQRRSRFQIVCVIVCDPICEIAVEIVMHDLIVLIIQRVLEKLAERRSDGVNQSGCIIEGRSEVQVLGERLPHRKRRRVCKELIRAGKSRPERLPKDQVVLA